MLNSYGVRNIFQNRRRKIDFPIRKNRSCQWQERLNVTEVFISYQKIITWQEMISLSLAMYGTNGKQKRSVYIVALAISFLILPETMAIWNRYYMRSQIWKKFPLKFLAGNS